MSNLPYFPFFSNIQEYHNCKYYRHHFVQKLQIHSFFTFFALFSNSFLCQIKNQKKNKEFWKLQFSKISGTNFNIKSAIAPVLLCGYVRLQKQRNKICPATGGRRKVLHTVGSSKNADKKIHFFVAGHCQKVAPVLSHF